MSIAAIDPEGLERILKLVDELYEALLPYDHDNLDPDRSRISEVSYALRRLADHLPE